jgi:hypothetical protein
MVAESESIVFRFGPLGPLLPVHAPGGDEGKWKQAIAGA